METRPEPDIKGMFDKIRKITPEDLYLTEIALNGWPEKMKNENSDERIWNSFLETLPIGVRDAILSIHQVEKDIASPMLETQVDKRKGISAEDMVKV